MQLENNAINIFRKCIGKRISYIESNRIDFSEHEISFPDRRIRISFFGGFSFELMSEFFETDFGEVFHDYRIMNDTPYTGKSSRFTINSDVIEKIEVYGRPFHIEKFWSYPEIYKKFKKVDKTHNLFILNMENGERIMLVMHEFFPFIEMYLDSRSIKEYFDNTQSEYSLDFTI